MAIQKTGSGLKTRGEDHALDDTQGKYLSAELCCRYFRPGSTVRGIVQLRCQQTTADPSTEVTYVVAQIHAHVSVDSNFLSVPVVPLLSPRSASQTERQQINKAPQDAYFWENMNGALPDIRNFSGDTGACIYQSAPWALMSEVNIAPTASESAAKSPSEEALKRCTREFAIALPEKCCPTFRGSSARVFYVLSVTAQTAMEGSKPVSVHIPFDVYASEYYFEPSTIESAQQYATSGGGQNGKAPGRNGTSASSNPSPRSQLRRDRSISVNVVPVGIRKGSEMPFELRPSLMHGRVETEQMQRAQTSIFTIGKDSSHLVRFLLLKQFYHPGEILLGVFDFTRAVIPCHSITASLCLEETLSTMSLEPSKVVQSKVFGTFHEQTTCALQTNVRFCIPHDALPTIRTDLVCFQWLLKLEFSTSADDAESGSGGSQMFQWQVPIVIKPAMAGERSITNVPQKFFTGWTRTAKLT